jgi:hypothetical protein
MSTSLRQRRVWVRAGIELYPKNNGIGGREYESLGRAVAKTVDCAAGWDRLTFTVMSNDFSPRLEGARGGVAPECREGG